MNQAIMNAMDAVAGSQASAYITMADGNRYCFMQLYNFEFYHLLCNRPHLTDFIGTCYPQKTP